MIAIDPQCSTTEFDMMYQKIVLNNTELLTIKNIAYLFRKNYRQSKMLLGLALEHSTYDMNKEIKAVPGSSIVKR